MIASNKAKYCIGEGSILEDLLEKGILWIEGEAIVGETSDGTEVMVGSCESLQGMFETEEYLKSHPTPEDW